tara:strand:+ start:530 stop:1393 length:864 start_codon:yes stop_codon:yes gene_type:complete
MRSIIFVIIGSSFIAACTVLAKIAQSDLLGIPLHPLQVAQARFLFAFMAVALVTPLLRPEFTKPSLIIHSVRTFCGYSAVSLLFAAAAIIPVSDATAIKFLNPVFAMFFALPILREKIGPLRWIAALIGLTGSTILIRPTEGSFEPAALMALTASLAAGLEMVLIKILTGRESPIQILLINNAIGLFLSSIALIFVWDSPTTGQWMVLASIGFLMVIGQAFNLQAFKGADATFVLPFAYSTLIFVTIYDFLVFSAVPDLISYMGSAVIIFGAVLLTVPEMRKSKLLR